MSAQPPPMASPEEHVVTTGQAAKYLGLTPRWVQKLAADGWVQPAGRGRWNLAELFRGYVASLKDDAAGRTRSAGEDRVRDARAAEIEMRLAERRRELVPIEDAQAAFDILAGKVRSEFGGLPARATRDLPERRKLEAEVNASFTRIAESLAALAGALRAGGDLPETGGADDP